VQRARRAWWLVAAVAAGLVTIAVVVIVRDFPWLMALFSGAAVGALVYVTLQTAARVRNQFRRD
jgi:hypothetical protein